MAKGVFKPNNVCEIVTGWPGNPPAQLKGGEVWRKNDATGELEPHPAFAENGRAKLLREFDIELVSNVIEAMLGSHLECRGINEKNRFCFRAHRGFDQIGVAQRRNAEGGLYNCECDPSKCDYRLNAIEPHSRTRILSNDYAQVYGTIANHKGTVKVERGGDKVEVAAAPRCTPLIYFIFRLLTPDGEYAHHQNAYCLFDSKAETNHGRFMDFLMRLWVDTSGHIAGRRVKMVYDPITTRFDKPNTPMDKRKPAWNLRHGDEDAVRSAIDAAQRTALQAVDWSQVDVGKMGTELVHLREPGEILKYVAAEHPDIIKEQRTDDLDWQKVSAEKIELAGVYLINREPMVHELIERCHINYARECALPMMFGSDMVRCIEWFKSKAANYQRPEYDFRENKITGHTAEPIDISDILDKYGWGETVKLPEPPEPVAADSMSNPMSQSYVENDVEAVDAEFTTVEDADAAVRGGESSFEAQQEAEAADARDKDEHDQRNAEMHQQQADELYREELKAEAERNRQTGTQEKLL